MQTYNIFVLILYLKLVIN